MVRRTPTRSSLGGARAARAEVSAEPNEAEHDAWAMHALGTKCAIEQHATHCTQSGTEHGRPQTPDGRETRRGRGHERSDKTRGQPPAPSPPAIDVAWLPGVRRRRCRDSNRSGRPKTRGLKRAAGFRLWSPFVFHVLTSDTVTEGLVIEGEGARSNNVPRIDAQPDRWIRTSASCHSRLPRVKGVHRARRANSTSATSPASRARADTCRNPAGMITSVPALTVTSCLTR